MAVVNIKDCIIRIRGGSPGQFIDVKIGQGNLTYDEKRTMQYIMDRGNLDDVREGDDVPMDVRVDATWEKITAASGDSVPTVEDAMKHRGLAADWDSSAVDPCQPFAVDVVILDVPPCGSEDSETIILPDFRYESVAHDLKAGTLAFSGKCNAKEAIPTRGAVVSY
jgi:hypothetical protein